MIRRIASVFRHRDDLHGRRRYAAVENPVDPFDGNACEWNVTSQGWSQGEAEHETGHLMMEKDHYSDRRDASGNRVTTADPGYESNLMGTLGKSVITDSQNMKSILSSNGNISVKEPPTSP